MLKKWLSCICAATLLLGLGGCEDSSRKVKIGVSIGSGGAARWQKDMAFMEERAKALKHRPRSALKCSPTVSTF